MGTMCHILQFIHKFHKHASTLAPLLSLSRSDRNNDNKLSYQEAIMRFFVGLILDERDKKSEDCKYSDMAAIKVRSCYSNRVCLCMCVCAT